VEYAKLPTKPPDDCYVTTAAANGHRWFVRSKAIRFDSGAVKRVNRQLAVFKAAELALRTLSPPAHRILRRVYDFLGPKAAARIQSPFFADVAYVALKPFELVALVVLFVFLGANLRIVNRFYNRDDSLGRAKES
jgi:hypothetical protein